MHAFIGEIRMFPYDYAPEGWLECDGALLDSERHQALHSVIGHRFGGSGRQFRLPDLRGRAGRGAGAEKVGEAAGASKARVSINNMPPHRHSLSAVVVSSNQQARSSATPDPSRLVSRLVPASGTATVTPSFASTAGRNAFLDAGAVTVAGVAGGSEIDIVQPYLALRACICADGEYPTPQS